MVLSVIVEPDDDVRMNSGSFFPSDEPQRLATTLLMIFMVITATGDLFANCQRIARGPGGVWGYFSDTFNYMDMIQSGLDVALLVIYFGRYTQLMGAMPSRST